MTYTDAIKSGFRLINKNWQLIFIQFGRKILSCALLFIFVFIPLGIAFVIFGLDLSSLTAPRDILDIFTDPTALLSKYLGLIVIIVICLLLYILSVTTLWLYVFGGTLGVIGRSLMEPTLKFSLKTFFAEAKRLFSPLMWFAMFIGLIFMAVSFIFGIIGGGIAALVSFARTLDSTLALFLGWFFFFVLILCLLSMTLVFLAVSATGSTILFFRNEGPTRALKDAVKFLRDKPDAFWLYMLSLIGYFCINFVLILLIYPFNLIPVIGTIIFIPLQFLLSIVQGYLGLVLIAIIVIYYSSKEIRLEPIAEGSTQGSDTSLPQAPAQAPSLPEKEAQE